MPVAPRPKIMTFIEILRLWQLWLSLLFIAIVWFVPAETRDELFYSTSLGLVIGLAMISLLCTISNFAIGNSALLDASLTVVWLVLMALIITVNEPPNSYPSPLLII